jgi:hypothetical protein
VPDKQLIAEIPFAPWLPPGSTAEVWAGADCAVPEPCIIVRLLLSRRGDSGKAEFFCSPTHRGLDIPALPLGSDPDRLTAAGGLYLLAGQVLGRSEAAYPCIGYVRNVVPYPDAGYPHPAPLAHIPVFVADKRAGPVADGTWVTLDAARPDLHVRHWWPIVEHRLTAAAR